MLVFSASGAKLAFTVFGQVPADVTIVRQDRVELVIGGGVKAQVDVGSGTKASAVVEGVASDVEADDGSKATLTIA